MFSVLKIQLGAPEDCTSSNEGKNKKKRSSSKEQPEGLLNVSGNPPVPGLPEKSSFNNSECKTPSSSQSSTQNSPPSGKSTKTKLQSSTENDQSMDHNIKASYATMKEEEEQEKEEGTEFLFFFLSLSLTCSVNRI
jgi:cobalamin biosynthesis Mg chelatase CobN